MRAAGAHGVVAPGAADGGAGAPAEVMSQQVPQKPRVMSQQVPQNPRR